MKLTLVLHNIRSVYNVGAILRTAEGLGVATVAYSGYTPRLHDPAALPHLQAKLDRQIAKSALGAEELVPQILLDDLPAWLTEQKSQQVPIFGLENNLSAEEGQRKIVLGDERDFPDLGQNYVLLLGEEVHGIPPEIRQFCDYFLEIPMVGSKESFNVSVATAIAVWELSRRTRK